MHHLKTLLVSALALGSAASGAVAATAYHMIAPADLLPLESTMQYSADAFHLEPIIEEESHLCFMAGVRLPDAARIQNVVTAYKSGAVSNPHAMMFVGKLANDGGRDFIFDKIIKDNSGTHKTSTETISGPIAVIDNKTDIYTYEICLGDQDHFYGARIDYKKP